MSSYRLVVTASVVLLGGCGALTDNDLVGGEEAYIRDRGQDYEDAQVANKLVIPPHLDAEKVQDLLVIPDIGTAAVASDEEFGIPRPDFFTAEAGNDKVNLARDGQERLIIVNEPLAQVWDKLQEFWDFNDQEIVLTDPQRGLMETAWIDSGEEAPGFFSRLVSNLTFSEVDGPAHDKLRAYLKAVEGDQASTSISLRHLRTAVTDTSQVADWSSDAQNVGYKSQVMYEILHYLSKSTVESTASAVRERQNQRGRVYFGRGSEGQPVLKLTTSVDQSWELIEHALIQARVDVGSSDRSLGKYYITYTSALPIEDEDSPGFFAWLHGDRGEITLDTGSLETALGVETDDNGPQYSSSDSSRVALTEEEAEAVEQKRMSESDGYKVWMAGEVIFVFGGSQQEGVEVDPDSGIERLTDQYQIKLTRRSSGVYVSVLNEDGLSANNAVAEDILWTLKENMQDG
ncbi:MAG: outer membrane protein assembly factor BamC [Halopseudomonas sp.]